jgi:hypothetical protein
MVDRNCHTLKLCEGLLVLIDLELSPTYSEYLIILLDTYPCIAPGSSFLC